MYYATKRNNTQTRLVGLGGVIFALGGAGYAVANGFGLIENKVPEASEVVIIEELEEVEEDEPPPPPVDVDLPPPPPQVILPDFVFETPPPQVNAVTQVQAVRTPSPPPPPAAKPAPPPRPTLQKRPQIGRRFKEPDYPAAAKRAGEEGETRVSVCVDTEGRMSNVKIVRGSGSQRLDDAAIKALNGNRLDPAIGTDGKAIAMCDPYPFEFTYVWTLKKD